ncbi:hypothetical protein ABOM_004860 [Aspergillus bombycis]|uniref:Uncharacterized protein n=1 Tax=Aspergillus bombycis TaxID=109264 RepID=A0A1F8A3C3_9EURO|nr:hypothetical protein ABOM_004860 [Aspergillus bombycis]OGM46183.1 hypothetical protein ABOM_004860 [Aspergillus bombycis]
METEHPVRLERRKILLQLERTIEQLQVQQIDLSELRQFSIAVQPMTLTGNSDSRPSFFTRSRLLDEPDDELLEKEYPTYPHEADPSYEELEPFLIPYYRAMGFCDYLTSWMLDETCGRMPGPWSSKCVGDYTTYKSLFQYHEPAFGALYMTDLSGPDHPHTKAIVYNNVNTTDQAILRGELLLILRLMIGQLRKRRFIRHMVAPVLLFSIVGPQHARIIEATFDGSNLNLRSTKIFDLRYKNVQGLKDFAEYYLGPPIGDTVKT